MEFQPGSVTELNQGHSNLLAFVPPDYQITQEESETDDEDCQLENLTYTKKPGKFSQAEIQEIENVVKKVGFNTSKILDKSKISRLKGRTHENILKKARSMVVSIKEKRQRDYDSEVTRSPKRVKYPIDEEINNNSQDDDRLFKEIHRKHFVEKLNLTEKIHCLETENKTLISQCSYWKAKTTEVNKALDSKYDENRQLKEKCWDSELKLRGLLKARPI